MHRTLRELGRALANIRRTYLRVEPRPHIGHRPPVAIQAAVVWHAVVRSAVHPVSALAALVDTRHPAADLAATDTSD